jgi:hypothetical protein
MRTFAGVRVVARLITRGLAWVHNLQEVQFCRVPRHRAKLVDAAHCDSALREAVAV